MTIIQRARSLQSQSQTQTQPAGSRLRTSGCAQFGKGCGGVVVVVVEAWPTKTLKIINQIFKSLFLSAAAVSYHFSVRLMKPFSASFISGFPSEPGELFRSPPARHIHPAPPLSASFSATAGAWTPSRDALDQLKH